MELKILLNQIKIRKGKKKSKETALFVIELKVKIIMYDDISFHTIAGKK